MSHYDFAVMEVRLEKECISDPRGRIESAYLTESGIALAKELAKACFGQPGCARPRG